MENTGLSPDSSQGAIDRLFWLARAFVQFFSSLKLAVVVVLSLAVAQAVGTVIESKYDAATAKYWVYSASWFYVVLMLLAINIATVALSRWPWKKRHTPFLMAHAGILLLLFGSWLTAQYGLDGTLRLDEGQAGAHIELPDHLLMVKAGASPKFFPISWVPTENEFNPIELSEFDLTIDRMIPHADADFVFGKPTVDDAKERVDVAAPAIKLRLSGGPFSISQDVWLWAGSVAWSRANIGPAQFTLIPPDFDGFPNIPKGGEGAAFEAKLGANGSLLYRIRSKSKAAKLGTISADQIGGKTIETGWMGMRVAVMEWLPRAINRTKYRPSRILYGSSAPPPAIHLVAGGDDAKAELWLGLGDRATVEVRGIPIQLAFIPKRVSLPFSLKLQRFNIDLYEGTKNPMSYWSKVKVLDSQEGDLETTIMMNEPLDWRGFTFYQASYIPGEPRPTVSVFSVNRDPGRWAKYLGSLMIVLGAIWLFSTRFKKKKNFFEGASV